MINVWNVLLLAAVCCPHSFLAVYRKVHLPTSTKYRQGHETRSSRRIESRVQCFLKLFRRKVNVCN